MMLVIKRKLGEAIILGDNIEVRLLNIKGSKFRIGIHAPKDLEIKREEDYDKDQETKKAK